MNDIPTHQELLDAMTKTTDTKDTAAPGKISCTVDAREFTNRLKAMVPHIERGTIPILNYILIAHDKGGPVRVEYRGIDITMKTTVPGRYDVEDGAVVLPAKTLLGFVKASGAEEVTFRKDPTDSAVSVAAGRYAAKLYPLHPSDIPDDLTKAGTVARAYGLPEGVLAHLFAMTLPFVSTEETRYYLNGVCFEVDAGKLRGTATDGHRLGTRVVVPAGPPAAEWKERPIIPNPACAAISKLVGSAQCDVQFRTVKKRETVKDNGVEKLVDVDSPSFVSVASGPWEVGARLIDGTFPEWRRVIPEDGPGDAVMTMKTDPLRRFRSIMKTAGSKPWGRGVKIEGEPEGFKLSSDLVDGGAFTGFAAGTADGLFFSFGVNIHFLTGIANVFGKPDIHLRMKDSGSPIRVTAPGSDDFAILMPMRV